MRRLGLAIALSISGACVALASDIVPSPVPPPQAPAVYLPAPPPAYNWSGFYVGGNLGAGGTHGSFNDSFGNSFNASGSQFKFLGGGQVGVNYEFLSGIVIGAEADFDWLPNTNNTSNTVTLVGPGVPPGTTASLTANNNWVTTVTGRLGYAWDRLLLYGKGGWAFVGNSNPTITINGVSSTFNTSSNNNGWTAGGGLEYAFFPGFSGRVEYDFIGLNNRTLTVPASSPILPSDSFVSNNRNIQMITVGLNYKFGPWW